MSIEIVHCALTLDGLKSSYGVTFLWTEMLKCYERATRYPGLHKEKDEDSGAGLRRYFERGIPSS